ncbi:hypothetical protein [Rhodopseudomonas palustris]|uniref:hypothetical protein n=1 Tax=Rhodopseudomonas palustris TaxID=1076 RepID=UPI0021F2BB6C|nr:hypothetical protein [Rhodopseudomonas palustris]UYO54599.1 hypothetical protein KQX61_04025 [Rhodopseudomonas palustris]
MKQPIQCELWEKPELARLPIRECFELLETIAYESHHWRYLLRCRECGQLYFFEFLEFIDWKHGNDPQYSTYIPVETAEEIEILKSTSPGQLLLFYPRLQIDRPSDAKSPSVSWIGKDEDLPHPPTLPSRLVAFVRRWLFASIRVFRAGRS